MTSIRLTAEQLKEMDKYPISKSEFVRRAVDNYLLYLKDPYTHMLLLELEAWIKYKKDTSVLQNNTDVPKTSTNVLQNNTDVPKTSTNVYENEYKKQETNNTQMEQLLKTELSTLQRLLNNPENNDTVPDYTLKMLSKKYAISKSSIEAWIAENREYLKHEKFEEYS